MDECICCGATVPEGRQICLICEKGDIVIAENENRVEVFPMAPRKKKIQKYLKRKRGDKG